MLSNKTKPRHLLYVWYTYCRYMSHNTPFVSVVIPAYNEEKYIEKTLQCIAKQTYKHFEIIVVDNNSTDRTPAIAKQYGATVLQEQKQGHVFALNSGMSHAKGDIIAVTDADTIPPPSWLATIVNALTDDEVIGVTGSAIVSTGSQSANRLLSGLYSMFMTGHMLLGKPHMNGFSFAVKKKYFSKVGGLDLNYQISSDVDLGIRLNKLGKVLFVKELSVITSTRRWTKNPTGVLLKYAQAYAYAVWLRKPPPSKLSVIR
jgi:glycosyltransferase involved in cell wall biosynthesis